MFNFFQTIFSKVVSVIASGIIAVGLISVPTPQTSTIANQNDLHVIGQQKTEETEIIQQVQLIEEAEIITKSVDNSAELEKAKQEAETQRIAEEQAESRFKEIQNQQAIQSEIQTQNALAEQQRISKEQETQKLDALLKMFDDQITEKHRQTELALQQLETDRNEMNQLQSPIQSELDALMAKIETECPVSVFIGSQAQQCNVWRADAGILIAKISAITAQYSAKIGVTPTLNFTTQQSVLGQHYEFYYGGNGSGIIYNANNPADSYKVYCSYGKCDIYGN